MRLACKNYKRVVFSFYFKLWCIEDKLKFQTPIENETIFIQLKLKVVCTLQYYSISSLFKKYAHIQPFYFEIFGEFFFNFVTVNKVCSFISTCNISDKDSILICFKGMIYVMHHEKQKSNQQMTRALAFKLACFVVSHHPQ